MLKNMQFLKCFILIKLLCLIWWTKKSFEEYTSQGGVCLPQPSGMLGVQWGTSSGMW